MSKSATTGNGKHTPSSDFDSFQVMDEQTTPNVAANNIEVGATPLKKEEEESQKSNKRPGRVSEVWDHFSKVDGSSRCTCNYCGKDYAWDSRRLGTTTLWDHLKKQCKKYPHKVIDKKQKVLSFHTGNDGSGSLIGVTYSKERCRQALCRFVVLDEQPFNVVEGEGFRGLVQELEPKFVVPSRMTVSRDIDKLLDVERLKLKKELTKAGQRICLTTDCWTSCTQMAFMCLTAHYIDSDWHLQKRIINFCQITDHKGETIGKEIEACLISWGIEKIVTVTVDNASANDVAINFVKRRVNAWKGSILDGEFMHLRCGAHIVNLIVNEGLKDMNDSIVAIRNSVRYIRPSPARLETFKGCVEKEKIDYKGGLVLDVSTRWNSTFMMLEAALKFDKAIERYKDEDEKFLKHFKEDDNGRKRVGSPSFYDWECASIFIKFLSTFHDVTLKFSSTLHVTSNNFYHEISDIHTQLGDLIASKDPLLSNMAVSMKKKYDKYWGNPDDINPFLFVAVVLDPRYKMRYLKYCFQIVYDVETCAMIVVKVEKILQRLNNDYNVEGGIKGASPSLNEGKEAQKKKLLEGYLQHQRLNVSDRMNDVDRYLNEEPLNPMTPCFDILLWWKDNSSRFKTLSLVARDLLAIPVSTVASESAFSTSGRILDAYRSSLSPKTLETLICTQSWLKGTNEGILEKDYMDDMESYQFLEEELKDNSTMEAKKSKSVIID